MEELKLPESHKITKEEADELCADFLQANKEGKVKIRGEKFIFRGKEVAELLAEDPGGNLLIKHGYHKGTGKHTLVLETTGGITILQKPGCC